MSYSHTGLMLIEYNHITSEIKVHVMVHFLSFSMEVVGRFTADKEEEEYEIAPNTPAWLPTRVECSQFTSEVKSQLKWLREAIMISYLILSRRKDLNLKGCYHLSDHRKHLEKFEKFHFHPQKLFLLKISGNSQHQNVSTRNKPQHQMVSTRNKRQHQNMSTRNKPKHQTRLPGINLILFRVDTFWC